jgi:hypothetical protein
VRILFVINRMAHVRHFDRAIRLLADRGHDICLAAQEDDLELPEVLRDQPRITTTLAPDKRGDDWGRATTAVRRSRDYIRYLHPRYADAKLLRRRAFEKVVGAVSGRAEELSAEWAELLLGMNKPEQKRLDAILAMLETAIPDDPGIRAFIAAQRPDLLVVSPMVGVGFSQADYVKSARALGIPSGMLVFSWDNLSNKGLIHAAPDRMWIWNQTQAQEAVKLHHFPREHVVITGAPRFDAFFDMRPAIGREQFCVGLGLDPARPVITYLCSSKFVAAAEQEFVQLWINELRSAADPELAGCSVVVRLHPAGVKDWHAPERTVLRWPGKEKASASKPFADDRVVVMNSPLQNADQVLYDTIHHSAAVVGLNTSAEIEAAIVGRPVYTIIDPAAEGQKGTLHFHYLLREQGGHVYLARSFDEHRAQLTDALHGGWDPQALHNFLSNFVRPRGLDQPVSPFVADAIESLGAEALLAAGAVERAAR